MDRKYHFFTIEMQVFSLNIIKPRMGENCCNFFLGNQVAQVIGCFFVAEKYAHGSHRSSHQVPTFFFGLQYPLKRVSKNHKTTKHVDDRSSEFSPSPVEMANRKMADVTQR